MEEGLTPGQVGVWEPKPSCRGWGGGSQGGAGTQGQWRYLRVVGVGIVVSPGSVQREQHSWAQCPSARMAQGRPSQQGGAGSFLGRGGADQGLNRAEGPSLSQGLARLSYLVPGPKAPSGTFPEPLLECKGGGERAWRRKSFQSFTHAHSERNVHLHTHREVDTLR